MLPGGKKETSNMKWINDNECSAECAQIQQKRQFRKTFNFKHAPF